MTRIVSRVSRRTHLTSLITRKPKNLVAPQDGSWEKPDPPLLCGTTLLTESDTTLLTESDIARGNRHIEKERESRECACVRREFNFEEEREREREREREIDRVRDIGTHTKQKPIHVFKV